MPNEIFIARQPILDRDGRTFGYELLHRDSPDDHVVVEDPDDATRSVIQRAMLDWGMERLIGDRFGFVNASPQLILDNLHRALPPEGIIIELVEDDTFDTDIVDAIARAHREGYHFALDNVRHEAQLRNSAVMHLVSMVKVDVRGQSGAALTGLVEYVRGGWPGVLLAAEKVESPSDHSTAMQSGFDLFEGYFFQRPEVLARKSRPSSVASTMSLMAEMQRNDIAIDRVEELVGSDPSLAYRLLAVVNSSAFGLDRRVESLRHAIILLGITQVRYLTTLIALSAAKDVNEELVAIGTTRGKLASMVAPTQELRNGAFTVGLLSVTDALYRTPMAELLEDLPVSAEIREALVDGTGPYGSTLEIVKACERADMKLLAELAPGRIDEIQERYAEAVQWADTMRSQLIGQRSKVQLPRNEPQLVH